MQLLHTFRFYMAGAALLSHLTLFGLSSMLPDSDTIRGVRSRRTSTLLARKSISLSREVLIECSGAYYNYKGG